MKKSIFLSLVLSLAIAATGFANTDPDPTTIIAKTKLVKEKTIELRLANLMKDFTEVSITDLRGQTTYYTTDIENHNGYATAFNIEDLENGKYIIQVKRAGKTLRQLFRIDDREVFFSSFK